MDKLSRNGQTTSSLSDPKDVHSSGQVPDIKHDAIPANRQLCVNHRVLPPEQVNRYEPQPGVFFALEVDIKDIRCRIRVKLKCRGSRDFVIIDAEGAFDRDIKLYPLLDHRLCHQADVDSLGKVSCDISLQDIITGRQTGEHEGSIGGRMPEIQRITGIIAKQYDGIRIDGDCR